MTSPPDDNANHYGPLSALVAWMARNHVASNLLMFALLGGGIAATFSIKQEVFPSFQLDIVDIRVPYPGASPSEVEDGVLLPIEEAIRGLEVVERITSIARQGTGEIEVELVEGVDTGQASQDIKNAIDSISFFPDDAERPTLGLRLEQDSVMWMVVYGPFTERQSLELTERIRRGLLALPEVSQISVFAERAPEVRIEIPEETLRSLDLTLGEVADLLGSSARDVPAGGVRTPAGEVLLSTRERRDFASEYGDIPLVSSSTGAAVLLRDAANITDGYDDRAFRNLFDGGYGIFLSISATASEKPLEIAEAVHRYLDEVRAELPEGAGVRILRDRAEEYRERLDLLFFNGAIGLLLVIVVLGLFLEPRLAFWVAMGIPTTIAGSLLLLPALGASINMISLFAFIITLGIVVDDAVIVGENVFHRMQQGRTRLQAAIEGSHQMVVPILFAVMTNIIAFMPLLIVPGETGRFFAPLPAVVIAVFAVSLVEALFILPAHLGHGPQRKEGRGPLALLGRAQARVSDGFERLTDIFVVPVVRAAVHWRFFTVCVLSGCILLIFAWYYSGRMNYTFNPVITGLRVDGEIQTPVGSAFEDTLRIADHIEAAGLRAADRLGGRDKVLNGRMNVSGRFGENWADVNFFLVSPDERDFDQETFARLWREEVGEVPGLKSLYFEWEEGPGGGAGLTIELSHPDREVLEEAAGALARELATFTGVSDIKDGFSSGKQEIEVELTQEGRFLGLTPEAVGRQVRNAFYGAEALRFQRGRHEVKVMVRLPEDERRSLSDVEDLIIRTPNGGEAPLSQVAVLRTGTANTDINRVDGQRVINVTCNVVPELANVNDIRAGVTAEVLPRLADRYRGLSYSFSGRQREETRAMAQLQIGLVIAGLACFALLAALFRSYVQSLIVLTSIPCAIAAALAGHVMLDYDLSIVSLFGMIALSGLVVNGGLVLNEEINRILVEERAPIREAVVRAARRRFRPILLTSLTTFAGLAPMIFETSSQARFLVPMAIALGFGTLFAMPGVILLPVVLRTVFPGHQAAKADSD